MHNATNNLRYDIKVMFKGYRSMTKSLRHRLKGLGFSIYEDGAHYKLFYSDDTSRFYTLSKTASDYRTGKNFASQLIRGLNI
jgi:hypothetical protein